MAFSLFGILACLVFMCDMRLLILACGEPQVTKGHLQGDQAALAAAALAGLNAISDAGGDDDAGVRPRQRVRGAASIPLDQQSSNNLTCVMSCT